MPEGKLKLTIEVQKMWRGTWGIGVGITVIDDEAYITFNLLKWAIHIGKMMVFQDGDEKEDTHDARNDSSAD